MQYRIRNRTSRIAQKLGVLIRPSTNPDKKIDVFIPLKDNKYKKLSIGDIHYADYHIYKELENVGKVESGTAEKRRLAYIKRHIKDIQVVGSKGYYAFQLLWN